MGLAASQSRFLSLQNRKYQVGNDLVTLANRKQALTREMRVISNYYGDALKQSMFKFSIDQGQTTYDINYDLLMKPNELNCESPYIVTDKEGRVVVDDNKLVFEGTTLSVSYRDLARLISMYSGYDSSGAIGFLNTSRVDADGEFGEKCVDPNEYRNNQDPSEVSLRNRICRALGILDPGMSEYKKEKIMDYYDAVLRMIAEKGWVYDEKVNNPDDHQKSQEYLNTMLKNNQYFLTEARRRNVQGDYYFVTKQSSNIAKIYEVQDENYITEAYGNYSAKRSEIAVKEKKVDQMMSLLESEQEAIETELESLKTIENQNIEINFRIFA